MANGIRTGNPRGFNKGHSSKFRQGSRVRQTPEEGRRTYRPKRCGNNNKDEDNSPTTLNDKNQQASSQKFRQLILFSIWKYDKYNELCPQFCSKEEAQNIKIVQFHYTTDEWLFFLNRLFELDMK